jgi:UDP-N-acetyl-2-amino-2-deoxyglucuronate dehydrogenase
MGGVDEVKAFTATRAHPGLEVEDVAVAALRFRSGAVGVVEASTASWPGDKLRIEISGSEGSVVLEDEAICSWRFRTPHPEDDAIRAHLAPQASANSGGATDPKAIDSAGHRRQFEDFVAAIRDDRPPRIDGAEGRASVAIITAIYRSAREQLAVGVAQ